MTCVTRSCSVMGDGCSPWRAPRPGVHPARAVAAAAAPGAGGGGRGAARAARRAGRRGACGACGQHAARALRVARHVRRRPTAAHARPVQHADCEHAAHTRSRTAVALSTPFNCTCLCLQRVNDGVARATHTRGKQRERRCRGEWLLNAALPGTQGWSCSGPQRARRCRSCR